MLANLLTVFVSLALLSLPVISAPVGAAFYTTASTGPNSSPPSGYPDPTAEIAQFDSYTSASQLMAPALGVHEAGAQIAKRAIRPRAPVGGVKPDSPLIGKAPSLMMQLRTTFALANKNSKGSSTSDKGLSAAATSKSAEDVKREALQNRVNTAKANWDDARRAEKKQKKAIKKTKTNTSPAEKAEMKKVLEKNTKFMKGQYQELQAVYSHDFDLLDMYNALDELHPSL